MLLKILTCILASLFKERFFNVYEYLPVYMYICMYVCAPSVCSTLRDQERVLYSPSNWSLVVNWLMRVLGTELESSARSAKALNH